MDIIPVIVIFLPFILNILNIIVFRRKCLQQPINHLLLWMSVFDLINFYAFFLSFANADWFPFVRFVYCTCNLTSAWLCIFVVAAECCASRLQQLRLSPREVNMFVLILFIVLLLLCCCNSISMQSISAVCNNEIFGCFALLSGLSLFILATLLTLTIIGTCCFSNRLQSEIEHRNSQNDINRNTVVLVLLISIFLLSTSLPSLFWILSLPYLKPEENSYSETLFNVLFYIGAIIIIFKWQFIQVTFKIFVYYVASPEFRKTANSLCKCCSNPTDNNNEDIAITQIRRHPSAEAVGDNLASPVAV